MRGRLCVGAAPQRPILGVPAGISSGIGRPHLRGTHASETEAAGQYRGQAPRVLRPRGSRRGLARLPAGPPGPLLPPEPDSTGFDGIELHATIDVTAVQRLLDKWA